MLSMISMFASGCASTPADPWWGPDKAAHLAVSSVLSAAATRVAMDSGVPASSAHAQAIGIVLVIGAGKEAYDARPGGTGWSWRDMSWNLLGALLGGALVRAVD
jgi:putative lipoprotein